MDSASTAAAFLAVIALSDGLRLLPAGAIVISRLAFGDWGVAWVNPEREAGNRLRLVTWCSPVLLSIVMGADEDDALSVRRRLARYRSRMRRTRPYLAALRIGGVLALVALIVLVPWLTSRSGLWGLLLGTSILMWLCVAQTLIAIAAFRRAGTPTAKTLLAAVRFLWPFSAPRAAEDVLRRVVSGVPPLVLLHELLPADEFCRVARPMLFDALRGDESDRVSALRAHLGESQSADIVNRPPSQRDGDAYCPRCGASFYRTARFCSDCAGVELRPQMAG